MKKQNKTKVAPEFPVSPTIIEEAAPTQAPKKRKQNRKPKAKKDTVETELKPQIILEIKDGSGTKRKPSLWQRFLNWLNEPTSIKIKFKRK